MKVRDSGMPVETMWVEFFDVDMILSEFEINSKINDLVEIGCGYGTFTIPASKQIKGNLYAFDIETGMLDIVRQKLSEEQIANVITENKDVLLQTTGLSNNSVDYVMLFNILHNETPDDFLLEAYRILKPEGKLGIMHWRSDISTPRGPELSIRPKPEQILQWINKDNFEIYKELFMIEPYHFGLIVSKRQDYMV